MKSIYFYRTPIIYFISLLMLSSYLLSSCSKDDDNTNLLQSKMVCTSMTISDAYDNDFSEENFYNATYEGNKIISYYNGYGDLISYEYSNNKIIQKGGYYPIITHNIENGRIVSTIIDTPRYAKTVEYMYKDNHIVEIVEIEPTKHNIWSNQLTWADGNLTKCHTTYYDDGDEEDVLYDYYDIDNNMPPFQQQVGFFFDELDPLLAYAGFYGNMPKKLLKSVDYGSYQYYYYYKFNDDGFPIEFYCGSSIIELTWDKVN